MLLKKQKLNGSPLNKQKHGALLPFAPNKLNKNGSLLSSPWQKSSLLKRQKLSASLLNRRKLNELLLLKPNKLNKNGSQLN